MSCEQKKKIKKNKEKKTSSKTKTNFLVSAIQTIKSIESDQQHKINRNIAMPTVDGTYST